MDMHDLLALNPVQEMTLDVRHVGEDRIPLMVVDNVLKDPEAVRAFALSLHYDAPLAGDLWPGLQAAASLHRASLEQFIERQYLGPVLGLDSTQFTFPAVRPGDKADQWSSWFLLTRFGVITMPFEQAHWANNPHVDHFGFLASVLYLNLPHQARGATVFIKHRRTGIETLPPPVGGLPEALCGRLQDTPSYQAIKAYFARTGRAGLLEQHPPGRLLDLAQFKELLELILTGNSATSGYLTASNPVWQITDQVEVRFNRLVLYPTWHLHSVSWDPSWYGEALPERRLTMMNWLNFPLAREC